MILKLALRNLIRKRQRTLITAGALGLAGTLVLFFSCLIEGFQHSMVSNIIDLETGHAQAHAAGYRNDPDIYTTLKEAGAPAGVAQSPRLYAWGLAALRDNSSAVELRGLDPGLEEKVSRIHTRIASGRWLDPAQPEGAVLGRELARKLESQVGDAVVVLAQAADGSLSDRLFTVRGILSQVSAKADEAGLFLNEAAFRDLLQLETGWHEIALRLPGKAPDAAAGAREIQGKRGDIEVLDWRRLKPMSSQILDTQRIGVLILMTIAYGAVGLVIFNAMLMNVFDRLREFGVMKALGATPGFVLRLVYAEALFESFFAIAIALGFGIPLSMYFEKFGINLGDMSGTPVAGMLFEPVLHPRVVFAAVWPPMAFLVVLAGLAVLYPAAKAALLRPVAAMNAR